VKIVTGTRGLAVALSLLAGMIGQDRLLRAGIMTRGALAKTTVIGSVMIARVVTLKGRVVPTEIRTGVVESQVSQALWNERIGFIRMANAYLEMVSVYEMS
jgi:hypothetical protein